MAIFFHDEKVNSGLRNKNHIKRWLKSVLKIEKFREGRLNIVFTSDEELRLVNEKFLSRDYYTDIITFDYSSENEISGDLYISLDRVIENAEKYGSGNMTELRRVMVHGMLHLMGYKDKTESEKALMRKKEDEYLLLFPEDH